MSEKIKEKLLIRHKERLDRFEQRRLQRLKDKNDTNEGADIFMSDFNKEKRQLLTHLHDLHADQSRDELTREFDKICEQLAGLQKFVSDSASFLPSYGVRRAHEILLQLQDDIKSKMDVLIPKKKFAFKSRRKAKEKDDTMTATNEEKVIDKNKIMNDFGFTERIDENLAFSAEESSGKDINISNLDKCTVTIHGHPSALRMKNLINTTVKCGPVSRVIFISDSYDCTFQLACQQLRIHSTSAAKFFIHVTSKAIIEDCEDVGFAPYNFSYDGADRDFQHAGLDKNVNNWNKVEDFNWLKLDEQSPNWFLIDKN